MRAGISVVIMTNDYARCRQVRRRNFRPTRLRSGTDDRRRWRIEVPPGVDDRLGTKAAHGKNEKDGLHPGPERLRPGHARVPVCAGARAEAKAEMTSSLRILRSPLFDERRLEKRTERCCEARHAA